MIPDTATAGWQTESRWTIEDGRPIYQIYVRSWRDANGDGVGDLRGLIELLPYFAANKVEYLWLSPVFPSPLRDGGYDISDFRDIDPMFGTLDIMDELIVEAGKLGIKIMLDFVIGHVSDEHEWFKAAVANPEGPEAKYFYFHPPTEGNQPPSNHQSIFGGDCWTMLPSGWWYYHTFADFQPELNYGSPAVMIELKQILRFWFQRGVAGARVDAVPYVGKLWHDVITDAPENPNYQEGDVDRNRFLHPEFLDGMLCVINLINEVAAEYGALVIYEAYPTNPEDPEAHALIAERFFSAVSTAICFAFIFTEFDARKFRDVVDIYLQALPSGAVPLWSLGNHDVTRPATRAGLAQAAVLLAFMMALPGRVLMYGGDEMGLRDGLGRTGDLSDPPGFSGYDRNRCRGYIPITTGPYNGFTRDGVTPWVTIHPDDGHRSAEVQAGDPQSHLSLYRLMAGLRHDYPELAGPEFSWIELGEGILGVRRPINGGEIVLVLNFTDKEVEITLPGDAPDVLFTSTGVAPDSPTHTLGAHEVLVLRSGPKPIDGDYEAWLAS